MPVAKYRGPGDTIDYTPNVAVPAGTVVVLAGGTAGKLVCVAAHDLVANEKGALHTKGVWEFDKLSTDVVTVGDKLWWDAGNSRMTLTASTHGLAGVAVTAAGNGVTRVEVRLNGTAA